MPQKAEVPHNLEKLIFEELGTGSKKIRDLIVLLQQKRIGTTKQGVYACLRVLRTAEKVVLHRGFASLNHVWLGQMVTYFTTAQQHYMSDNKEQSILRLGDGERVEYFFRDPVQTDSFWSHMFAIMTKTVPINQPLYLYNPHDWFLLVRHDNERSLIDSVILSGRCYIMTIGSDTPLDNVIAKEFDGINSICVFKQTPLFKKRNYYLNVIGNYLIEVYIDKRIADQIDIFYSTHERYTEDAHQTLEGIIRSRGRSRIVISKNTARALRLTRKLRPIQ